MFRNKDTQQHLQRQKRETFKFKDVILCWNVGNVREIIE